ncbi:hypothetical protein CASFOL_023608 [Castilleja foliolosa]|uniref:mitogen-activated protein kinase kinase kinase n=1 Tax=Castilleja foliolosa TaxID=1961234 RepID=A0ABD3CN12_9LAMI
MPSWWGRSSSPKEAKTKTTNESFIDTFHKKCKTSVCKSSSRRRSGDTISGRVNQLPSKHVPRCQSLAEWPKAQPLPLPGLGPENVILIESGVIEPSKPKHENLSKPLFPPLPRPAGIGSKLPPIDLEDESAVASVSSECSIESSNLENESNLTKNQTPIATQLSTLNLNSNKNISSPLPKRRPMSSQVPNLQVPSRGAFFSALDSSMSSSSVSPMRPVGYEHVTNSGLSPGKLYHEPLSLGSGHCSSPGSAQTSGHNSVGGDMSGQLFWQPSRGSPEYSPNPSPRMTSPGPSSRIQSGSVTPIHPSSGNWPEDAKQKSHRLPLPPIKISNSSPFSHPNSAATSPSLPRSPGRAENLVGTGSRWKKGKLLGRGTFGHVYVGFNSETGEMCAMKEVTLFADDAKSKESQKQLGQEIALLSRLKHPNIVQYYGTETVADKLYIYLEYVSGGSIHKILQDYGKLGESAIRSYTQQILSGLAYLHAKNTVHRDIKGANILVDPNGRVKLADFGMAKHITGQSCPLSFKGSPYWMAPEVIRNSNGSSLPVDIWSLGCTVLEMATAKPPWSQYEGIAAMFKIGNSKELPAIPDYLSDEGKEFVMLCLQRNPQNRPTAAQLLEHPFVKNAGPLEKKMFNLSSSDNRAEANNDAVSVGIVHTRSLQQLDVETLTTHSSRFSKPNIYSSDIYIPRNISCPVSPIGSPLLRPMSPQHFSGMMSPSPISSPRNMSGASTPLTGGIGSIPFHNQFMSSQDGFGTSSNQLPSPRANNVTSYWDPDILRGLHSGLHASRAGLLDHVSQQLVRDPVKLSPPFDLTLIHPLT